jgi:uncharacterized membrane protein (DUF4010 family)
LLESFRGLRKFSNVDAISLSMANLAVAEPDNLKAAARTIVIAVLSNTLVKAGMAIFLGAPALRRTLLVVMFLILIVAGCRSRNRRPRQLKLIISKLHDRMFESGPIIC